MTNNLISKQSSFIWFNPFSIKRIGRMRYFVWSFITLIIFIFLLFITLEFLPKVFSDFRFKDFKDFFCFLGAAYFMANQTFT